MGNKDLDLFGEDETSKEDVRLPVYHFSYNGYSENSFFELFNGYNELKVITYSSSINFIDTLLNTFDKAEIILGAEHVMNSGISEIFAFQSATIESLQSVNAKKNTRIHKMLKNQSLHFWLSNVKVTHEKIYLLSNTETGNTRVIFGSANMSNNAFLGYQWENICVLDNDVEGYGVYERRFEILKKETTDFLSYEKIKDINAEEEFSKLPFAETIMEKQVIIFEQDNSMMDREKFILKFNSANKKIKPFFPTVSKKKDYKFYAETITTITRKIREGKKVAEEQGVPNPEFVFNFSPPSALLNNKEKNLYPDSMLVKQDVNLFLKYINEFESFYGNIRHLQKEYYKFAVWVFCTPFISYIRNKAYMYEKALDPYPVFGIIYGTSKAGKSTFVKTLYKMMFGVSKISHPTDFTTKGVENLKRCVKGFPLFYDDLTQTTFKNHGDKIIKHDDFGLDEYLENYPCVIITGNEDIKAIDPQIARRVIQCYVDAGVTNMQVMRNSVANIIKGKITTALYDEYFRRMLEALPELISKLENESDKEVCDILQLSSKILNSVLIEYADDPMPHYVNEVSLVNYFDEKQTATQVITKINQLWNSNKKSFRILSKQNLLEIEFSEHWEPVNIKKALPMNLNTKVIKNTLSMDLKEARVFFENRFVKGIF